MIEAPCMYHKVVAKSYVPAEYLLGFSNMGKIYYCRDCALEVMTQVLKIGEARYNG